MLTKKEVSAYVDRMEALARNAAQEAYIKARGLEQKRIFEESGAIEIIRRMQTTMNNLLDDFEILDAQLESSAGIQYEKRSCRGLQYHLESVRNIYKSVFNDITFESRQLTRLEKDYAATNRGISANYAAIRAALKNKTKAAQCVAYLKEVGFDVSSLQKLECTEVAVALDKRYLFIGLKKEEK